MPPSPIRVLIISENRLFREGLQGRLHKTPDIQIVGAEDSKNTVAKTRTLKAQVILLHGWLGAQSSLEVLEFVNQALPATRVVVFGNIPRQYNLFDFIQAGAWGFIPGDATLADLRRIVRAVAQGNRVFPDSMPELFPAPMADAAARVRLPKSSGGAPFTKREREVVQLIAEGLSNKEIAGTLDVSTYTVKSHVHNILHKLELDSRLRIAVYASKNPLLAQNKVPGSSHLTPS